MIGGRFRQDDVQIDGGHVTRVRYRNIVEHDARLAQPLARGLER